MDFILFFQIVEKVEDLTKNNNKIYPVSDRKLPIKIYYRPCYFRTHYNKKHRMYLS